MESPVLQIREDWKLDQEPLGSRRKFWYQHPDTRELWLFKYPRLNTGEHWAEKVAAGVASVLGIPHANVELAKCGEIKGSVTKLFLEPDEGLFHGNQLLAGHILGYQKDLRYGQSLHTLEHIFDSFSYGFPDPEASFKNKEQFAKYLILDALIGNTDRHHENWGILIKIPEPTLSSAEQVQGWLAPTYDHASSLGRELRDEGPGKTRLQMLRENRIGAYSKGAQGGVFWNKNDRKAPNPIALVHQAASKYSEYFKPCIDSLNTGMAWEFRTVVAAIPDEFMKPLAKDFALALLQYNLESLMELRA